MVSPDCASTTTANGGAASPTAIFVPSGLMLATSTSSIRYSSTNSPVATSVSRVRPLPAQMVISNDPSALKEAQYGSPVESNALI